jgi:hypothetical protein
MNGELKELAGPYEIFDLQDGQSQLLKITEYELGTMKIKTAEVPEGKQIRVLRVHVPVGVKTTGAPYWDITSQTLIAQIMPWVENNAYINTVFKVTKHGVAPRARFTLEVSG